jgi:uncharacterized protein (UPF0276 family)
VPRDLRFLGAGVSWREAWSWDVVEQRAALGAVECIVEDLAGEGALRRFAAIGEAVPLLLHGIGLSLGSAEGLEPARLRQIERAVAALDPPWFSEHIAWTRAGGIEVGHLTPLPFTRAAVETVARNVEALRCALPGVPLLLENIAYTLPLPGSEMSEPEFVRAVVEAAGTGLLLDLENVHANTVNHGGDPFAYLAALPLDRVVEVHLAGGVWHHGEYADSHTRPVPEESWALLEWLVPRAPNLAAVIVERDDDLPPFAELLAEVRRAQGVLDGARRAAAGAGR